MDDAPSDVQHLDSESRRIVGMICSEAVPAPEIDSAIDALRSRAVETYPETPGMFDVTYGRRFQRLRTRFRPGPRLF